MFKFKLGRKQPEETETRRRIQKELFGLNKVCNRGFPSRPSAMAYDSQLKLIAIGTHVGEIRIYGQPDFQLSYNLETSSIYKMIFLNGLARLLILTIDAYLHLLEINNSNTIRIDRICTSNEDDGIILKQTQTICLLRNNSNLLIGLNNGNIYSFNLENFSLNTNPIIPTEIIEKTIVEHCSGRVIHPGPVQSIVQHPINDDKILIGYKNALIVHWDLPSNSHDRTYIYKQEVESVCWYNQGMNFATCHSNGSYALWDAKQQLNIVETEKIPYGPYPCTPMTNICVKIMRNDDPLIIFSGGLPRSNYSSKHTVSCLCENEHNTERTRHVAFDFTTKVIDFFTIDKLSNDGFRDDPQSLVVLLNEEIVIIDLITDSWPLYHLPYLNSIHASPVICTTFLCNVNQEFYTRLVNYASIQFDDYSDRKWPITGGEIKKIEDDSRQRDLLLTGHEDGSVQFWDVTNISMPLIYKLKTNDYFQVEQAPNDEMDEETWPPFRKTGLYDPYCDDPRLAVQKLALCTNTNTLIVAGTAGQVLTFQFTPEPTDVNIATTTVNLLGGCESFVWKGHEEMKTKSTYVSSGFLATSYIQLYPPAAVSALALCSDVRCYAVGTAHGFALIDYQKTRILTAKCTLNPHALENKSIAPSSIGEATLIRGRSLKKSLRESFRRFRKGRTTKKSTMLPSIQRIDENGPLSTTNIHLEEITRVPVERQVEFREFKQADDQVISMVRCLYFAKTYLNSVHDRIRSLWVGTNGGHVYVYSIVGLESQSVNRNIITTDQTSSCSLSKEIRLKHKAPVLSIAVLDGSNQSVGQGSGIPSIDTISAASGISHSTTNHSDNVTSHKVLICSEEQFKIFTLPHLKPFCKYKLTATEGTRVRKININQFMLKTDDPNETYSEFCLVCFDNMGRISIYSLPTLRRQILFNCTKPADITALSSLQFTPYGHAFYLQSSSELTEVAFSLPSIVPYSMMISYDKLQRKTILRTIEDKSTKQTSSKSIELNDQNNIWTHENQQEILSKNLIYSSTPKNIETRDETVKSGITITVPSNPKKNNSGFSTNSDSAIDLNSTNITNNNPSNEETSKSTECNLSSLESTPSKVAIEPSVTVSQNGHHASFSPVPSKSNKKSAAPPPPGPVKLISVKVCQAPTVNEVHCFNGTDNKPSSTPEDTHAIHT